jgi:hypothetical protein
LVTYKKERITSESRKIRLAPWIKGILEKVTVTQLVKKFPAICGIQWFINVFTKTLSFVPILNQMNPVQALVF